MRRVVEFGKQMLQDQLLSGSFFWKLPAGPDVALTFDDGPDPNQTPQILALLSRHQVRATFFVIGDIARQHPSVLREIVAAGHVIGSHTQTHRNLPTLNVADLAQELCAGRMTISDITGVDVTLVRPPRGKLDLSTLWRMSALGFQTIHWSHTYSDYLHDGSAKLLTRIRARPPMARDILLFHDTIPGTAEALATALPEWLARGNTFAGLDRASLGLQ